MDPLQQYPIPHPQVAGRVIDDEAVIVLSDTGQVQVLNEVGAHVWELIDGARSVTEIAQAIAEEFDVSLQEASADVLEFVLELEKEKIIVLADQPQK